MSEPLLLLPGLLCDADAWRPVAARLPGVDRRLVDGLPDRATPGAIAQALLADAPPVFALAGHSLGGRVALEIVRRVPQRVSRLALLDTGFAPLATGEAGERERRIRAQFVDVARAQGMAALARRWSEPMVHPSRLADAALMNAIHAMIERFTLARFERQVAALLARPDAADVLAALAVPTLVACGRDDGWAGIAQHEAMAQRVPGSRLVVVDDCGHMAPMERPREIAAALAAWMTIDARVRVA